MSRFSRRAVTITAIAAAPVVLATPAVAYYLWTSTTSEATYKAAGAPGAPQNLTHTATVGTTSTSGQVKLDWSSPSAPAGATFTYDVVRSGGPTVCAATSATTCTDTGLSAGSSVSYTVTPKISGSSWTGASASTGSIAVPALAPVTASSFRVTVPASVAAGTSTTVTVTALKSDGSTATGHTGTPTFTGTALGSSPNGSASTITPVTAFAEGVATWSLTPRRAGTGLTLVATQGSATGSTSLTVTAGKAQLGFASTAVGTTPVTCSPSTATAVNGNNTLFSTKVQVTNVDEYGNTAAVPTTGTITVTVTPNAGITGAFNTFTGGTQVITLPATTSATAFTMKRMNASAFSGTLTLTDSSNAYGPATCLLHQL